MAEAPNTTKFVEKLSATLSSALARPVRVTVEPEEYALRVFLGVEDSTGTIALEYHMSYAAFDDFQSDQPGLATAVTDMLCHTFREFLAHGLTVYSRV